MKTTLTTSARSAVHLWPLLPLLVALTGCGGGGGGSSDNNSSPPSSNAPKSVSAPVPDGLTATLAEDKASIHSGDSVTFTLTLTNATGQPVTFQPRTGEDPPSSTGTPVQAPTLGGSVEVLSTVSTPPGGGPGPGVVPSVIYPAGFSITPSGPPVFGPAATLAPGQSLSVPVTTGPISASAGQYLVTGGFEFAGATAGQLPVAPPTLSLTLTVQ